MDINKKIRDTFNPPPSLEGEDWLVPSSNVWDAIENDIAAKKKKRVGLFLLLGFAALILLFSLLFLHYNGSFKPAVDAPSNKTSYQTTPTSSSVSDLNTNGNFQVSEEQIPAIETGTENSNSSTIGIALKKEQNSQLLDQQVKQIDLHEQKITFSEKKNLPNSNTATYSSESKVDKSDLSFVLTGESANSELRNDGLAKSTKEVGIIMSDLDPRIYTSTLPFLAFNPLIYTNEVLEASFTIPLVNTQTEKLHKPNNALIFSAGTSFWDINMNDNYLSALEPANFDATNGSGYYLSLGYKKYLSSRFFTQADISFEHVEFLSGHNSVVEYSLANENGLQQNNFDVTMATPLGFLESNIEIERRGTDVADTESLTIDLHNSHRIGSINGLVQIGYDLLKFEKWNASIIGGIGYNYFLYTNNTLDRFDITNGNFESLSSVVLTDQESINSLRPYFSISSSIEYLLTSKSSLFLRYSFSQDLKNTYQFEDFSTRIARQNIGIGFQLRF